MIRSKTLTRGSLETLLKTDELPHYVTLPEGTADRGDKSMVLHNMRAVIAEAASSAELVADLAEKNRVWSVTGEHLRQMAGLEAVGLVAEGFESRLRQKGFRAAGSPVLALGVFSRGKLKDDIKGSLRRAAEEQLGKQETPETGRSGNGNGEIEIFAIEGVVHRPGLPDERSTRVLLAKIADYARSEQKLLVAPKHACMSIDGTDLTDYYLRLGFHRVGMFEEYDYDFEPSILRHELVYTGSSSSLTDAWMENRQLLIGMNLWAESSRGQLEHLWAGSG